MQMPRGLLTKASNQATKESPQELCTYSMMQLILLISQKPGVKLKIATQTSAAFVYFLIKVFPTKSHLSQCPHHPALRHE